MAEEAINLALTDAGVGRQDLQAAFFSNTFWGMFDNQHSIRGQVVLPRHGDRQDPGDQCGKRLRRRRPRRSHLAYTGDRAGMFDVAIAVGSEKITSPNKASPGAYASCMDVEKFPEAHAMIMEVGKTFKNLKIPGHDESTPGRGKQHLHGRLRHGRPVAHGPLRLDSAAARGDLLRRTISTDRSIPLSQYQQPMTVEEVLADKDVAWPLTRAMCAPVGDGAAACHRLFRCVPEKTQ